MSEAKLLNQILLSFTKKTNKFSRLFRNNTGTGWCGKLLSNKNGNVVLSNSRPVKFGLAIGSSDAIGWTSIEITPDMVGQKVAVFTAAETKTIRGKATKEQENFILTVKEAGGMAGVVKSLDDLDSLIESY